MNLLATGASFQLPVWFHYVEHISKCMLYIYGNAFEYMRMGFHIYEYIYGHTEYVYVHINVLNHRLSIIILSSS